MRASADGGNTRSAKVSMNSIASTIGSYGQTLRFSGCCSALGCVEILTRAAETGITTNSSGQRVSRARARV